MKGISVDDLSPAQQAEEGSSLERLANGQLHKLSERIRNNLDKYADNDATNLAYELSYRLMLATASYNNGAYLDAIERVCMGLDLKAQP